MIGRSSIASVGVLIMVALLVSAIAGGCSPAAAPSLARDSHPATLEMTAWRLVAIQGRQPPAGSDATLHFEAGRVAGNGGCNSFGGSYLYDVATGALAIGDLGSTKRACVEPARNDLEAAYFQALRGVATASVDPDGRLILGGSGAELVFVVGPQPGGPATVPTPLG